MPDYPAQKFKEECLADRGYRFVRKEGNDTVWRSAGLRTTVEAQVDCNGKVIYTDVPKEKK